MLNQLNTPQRLAVTTVDRPCLVLAGAGSGKTRVISFKIAYLIQQLQVEPQHITAVTFTNKAAREMQLRVKSLVKTERAVPVSTFHTLGLKILKQEAKHLGYKKNFSIYDQTDSLNLIKDLMQKHFGDAGNQAESMQYQISMWKSAFIAPGAAQQLAGTDPIKVAAAALYEQYQKQLACYHAFDFDDLIMQPVLLLRQQEDVLTKWRNNIKYMLVDEYQDTNTSQYELVKILVGDRHCLTVVGDDDQSIYAWRGAQPENLSLLNQDYPDLHVIKLEQNYRSSGRILHSANQIIANNAHVFEKKLWSERGYGDPIRVIQTKDAEDEAQQVTVDILHHKFTHRSDFKDYAILYRGNHQSRVFEQVLREHEIPYHISGGLSFFAYSEIKDLMAYMRLIANNDDDNAFIRIANTPRRGIGPNTLEKLIEYANANNHSLLSASMQSKQIPGMNSRAQQNLAYFAQWVIARLHTAENEPAHTTLKSIIDTMHYEQWLLDSSPDEIQAQRRIDNVQALIDWIHRLQTNDPDASLSDIIAKLCLIDNLDREQEQDPGNQVQLMTLHAAKGLEFANVYLVGMEENLLPHRTSIEEENIEEERRLAYVGITRAQKNLTLTYTTHRKRFGEIEDCTPSRFIDEIPIDDLEFHGVNIKQDPDKAKQRGQAQLANLKAMLK